LINSFALYVAIIRLILSMEAIDAAISVQGRHRVFFKILFQMNHITGQMMKPEFFRCTNND
jgi:hypothetical protein